MNQNKISDRESILRHELDFFRLLPVLHQNTLVILRLPLCKKTS